MSDTVPVEKKEAPLAMAWGEQADQKDDGLPWQVDVRGGQESGLRKFLEVEAEREEAEKTPAALVHVGDTDFRVYYKDGKWKAKGVTPDGTLHRFAADTRDAVMDKLAAFSKEQEDAIHDLTRSQEIEIARLCQASQVGPDATKQERERSVQLKGAAIARYLEYRLGLGSKYDHPNMAGDPALQQVMADCAYFTWLNCRADVQDSVGFRSFAADYAGNRPLNHDILDAAWSAFRQHREKVAREEAVERFTNPPEPTAREVQQGLEEMSDEQIEHAMFGAKREYVKQARAGMR